MKSAKVNYGTVKFKAPMRRIIIWAGIHDKGCQEAVALTKGPCGGKDEFCGMICSKCVNGKKEYMTTGPVRGIPRKQAIKMGFGGMCNPKAAPCPDGWDEAGYYHSHPNSSNFSPFDSWYADYYDLRAYVGSGAGSNCQIVRMYDPGTGQVQRID